MSWLGLVFFYEESRKLVGWGLLGLTFLMPVAVLQKVTPTGLSHSRKI